MSPVNTWTFLLLVCVTSIGCSKPCIWLQDTLKDGSKKILHSFQHMIPASETSDDCVTSRNLPDVRELYDVSKVEIAAITVSELLKQTNQFYKDHQEELVSNQMVWEQLTKDLYHQAVLLKDCSSTNNPIYPAISGSIFEKISNYFSELKKILEEQDDTLCAQRIIHANIKKNLLQADRLSMRMRRHYN